MVWSPPAPNPQPPPQPCLVSLPRWEEELITVCRKILTIIYAPVTVFKTDFERTTFCNYKTLNAKVQQLKRSPVPLRPQGIWYLRIWNFMDILITKLNGIPKSKKPSNQNIPTGLSLPVSSYYTVLLLVNIFKSSRSNSDDYRPEHYNASTISYTMHAVVYIPYICITSMPNIDGPWNPRIRITMRDGPDTKGAGQLRARSVAHDANERASNQANERMAEKSLMIAS